MAIALYARKSIERENSISCETQLEYCKAAIKPEERGEALLEYVDNGFSGGNVNRDGFQCMMREVERGRIRKIIVYRLDRISRSLADFVNILATLKKHGVEFVSSQEAFDTTTPHGEMFVKLLAVFAEYERQSIVERVRQAYTHRSEMGIYMGGRRPYGFCLSAAEVHGIRTKVLEPVAEEAGQIQYIFEAYAVAGVTLRRLMDDLMAKGMQPTEGSWSTGKLSTILRNPIYVRADNDVYTFLEKQNTQIASDISEFDGTRGVQLYGKTGHSAVDWSDIRAVVMPHQGLVPSEVWLACQKKLGKNRQIGNAASNTTSWLGGIVACKKCGRTMTVTKGGMRKDGTRTRYFSCTGKSHNRICTGPGVTVHASELENMADALIAKKLESLKGHRRKRRADAEGKINLLKNRMTEIRKMQERLSDRLLCEELTPVLLQLLNEKATALSEEEAALRMQIEKLENAESEISDIISFAEEWKTASYEERKAVTALLIHKIYISADGSAEVVWNV